MQAHKIEFNANLKYAQEVLASLKWKLRMLADQKRNGLRMSDQYVKQLDAETMQAVAESKSQLRLVLDMLEEHKVQGEIQRKQTDDCNLSLQSYLYEKSYYMKEIHACRETLTPNLDLVICKAEQRQIENST